MFLKLMRNVVLLCALNVLVGVALDPITFEFHHSESFVIDGSAEQEETFDEQYDIPMEDSIENNHVRKRRNAHWAPDYDLYDDWAKEYYANYDATEKEPETKVPGKDLSSSNNKTHEEAENERQVKRAKGEAKRWTIMVSSWAFCFLILYYTAKTYIKRILVKLGCGFCDVYHYKNKITQLVNNFTPGVYVHPNGKKEYYTPTEEEMEALMEIKKVLSSVRMI